MTYRGPLKYHILFFSLLLVLLMGVALFWVGKKEFLFGALLLEAGERLQNLTDFPIQRVVSRFDDTHQSLFHALVEKKGTSIHLFQQDPRTLEIRHRLDPIPIAKDSPFDLQLFQNKGYLLAMDSHEKIILFQFSLFELELITSEQLPISSSSFALLALPSGILIAYADPLDEDRLSVALLQENDGKMSTHSFQQLSNFSVSSLRLVNASENVIVAGKNETDEFFLGIISVKGEHIDPIAFSFLSESISDDFSLVASKDQLIMGFSKSHPITQEPAIHLRSFSSHDLQPVSSQEVLASSGESFQILLDGAENAYLLFHDRAQKQLAINRIKAATLTLNLSKRFSEITTPIFSAISGGKQFFIAFPDPSQDTLSVMTIDFPLVLGLLNISPAPMSVTPPREQKFSFHFDLPVNEKSFTNQSLFFFGNQSGRIPCEFSLVRDTQVLCHVKKRLFPSEQLIVTLTTSLQTFDGHYFLPAQSYVFEIGSVPSGLSGAFFSKHFFSWRDGDIPKKMEVSDLNHDQVPEFLVLFDNPSNIVMYQWKKNSLQEMERISAPLGTEHMKVLDLDQRDYLDLVTASSKDSGNESSLTFLFGNEEGYHQTNSFPVGISAQQLEVVDWDSDGQQEVALLQDRENRLSLYTPYARQFQSLGSFEGIFSPKAFEILDYDQNGHHDFIVLEEFFPGMRILLPEDILSLDLPEIPGRVLPGDFNQDGVVDFMVAFSDNLAWYTIQKNALLFQADITSLRGLRSLRAADFDGDLDLDLFLLEEEGLKIFRQEKGIWTFFQKEDIDDGLDMKLTDIDQDGQLEIFILTKKQMMIFKTLE